jgi:hypothetical protein
VQRYAAIDPPYDEQIRGPTATLSGVTTSSLFQSILQWLRGGYPEGVPGPDRVPLLALLRATPLTEDQVKEVVRKITEGESGAAAEGDITRDDIAEFISEVTNHDAGPENIARVAARLAAAGWPLEGFDEPGT